MKMFISVIPLFVWAKKSNWGYVGPSEVNLGLRPVTPALHHRPLTAGHAQVDFDNAVNCPDFHYGYASLLGDSVKTIFLDILILQNL